MEDGVQSWWKSNKGVVPARSPSVAHPVPPALARLGSGKGSTSSSLVNSPFLFSQSRLRRQAYGNWSTISAIIHSCSSILQGLGVTGCCSFFIALLISNDFK